MNPRSTRPARTAAPLIFAAVALAGGCREVEIASDDGALVEGSIVLSSTATGTTVAATGTGGGGGTGGSGGGAPEEGRRVFVTRMAYTGDLGGVDGADDLCDAAAAAAGLSGSWLAWLGTITTSPAARLVHSSIPYVRLDGVRVAHDWADLTDGALEAPIAVDETGAPVATSGTIAWTAADKAGISRGARSTRSPRSSASAR